MSTTVSPQVSRTANWLSWLIGGILFALPLITPFLIWSGSAFGHLDVFRIWKELLLVVSLPFFVWVGWQQPNLRNWLKSSWLVRIILFYVILSIVYGLNAINIGDANSLSVIYGLLINLRFLGFFILVLTVTGLSPLLEKHWRKIVLIPASIVIVFGLLQYFVLPADFLRHFGYGPDTIPFLQTVDNKVEFQRIQSTLRGANPLGAYLVLVLPLGWLVLRKWKRVLYLLGGGLVLLLTYSRSAWLGLLTSIGVIGLLKSGKKISVRTFGLIALILLVTFVGALWLARDVDVVQNTVFHTDESSLSSESSNEGRLRSLQSGLKDAVNEPFGRGVGTAGPASFRNDQPARIAENYYLQLVQEVGWLGLGLFVAINYMVGMMLWRQRGNGLALVLLATLIGITVINMLSHAWTDEVLSYTFWALCAVAVTPVILSDKDKHSGKKKKALSQKT